MSSSGFKLAVMATLISVAGSGIAQEFKAPSRVNLEDVSIQGQSNKKGLGFGNRTRYSLADRIKVRKDFREEISENVPTYFSPSTDQKKFP
jgi:hypothetical protein